MKILKLMLTVTIGFTAILGDYIVFKSTISFTSPIFRALSDSALHAILGGLSSILFLNEEQGLTNAAHICNILFCTFISAFIDIDHAFVARSLNLKDLTSTKQRGIFHCTTFCILITSLLILYSYVSKKLNVYILTWMLIVAYTSHHIRDAERRGLWLYPFGHTPPLTKALYISSISILPNILAILYTYMKPDTHKHTVINYTMLI